MKGNRGTDGLNGKDGADGRDGQKGERGETGPRGEQGMKGNGGKPGADGKYGQKGSDGEKGEKGEPGQKGEKGEPGQKGEKGDSGPKGESAASCVNLDIDGDGMVQENDLHMFQFYAYHGTTRGNNDDEGVRYRLLANKDAMCHNSATYEHRRILANKLTTPLLTTSELKKGYYCYSKFKCTNFVSTWCNGDRGEKLKAYTGP